jgi:hypothetical protein
MSMEDRHRAQVSSVLAERRAFETPVLAVCDGDVFSGSLSEGFRRVARLRPSIVSGASATFGQLLDTLAAFAGCCRENGGLRNAQRWLDRVAGDTAPVPAYPVRFEYGELDFAPPLECALTDGRGERDAGEIGLAFYGAVVRGVVDVAASFERCPIVVSGTTLQRPTIARELSAALGERLWR